MKNFIKMEKVFKCLKRKKFCEEERLYNLEDDFITCYKLGLFLGDTKWKGSGGIYSLQNTKYLTYFDPKSREFYHNI